MPHLLIRGLSPQQVSSVSRQLAADLAELCQCPPDHFILECQHTTAVFHGEVVPSYPFVEVAWFERGTDIRDRFAAIVHRHVRGLAGIDEAEIAFRVYREDHYYINGQPAGNREESEETGTAALRRELQTLKETNSRLRGQLQKAVGKPLPSAPDSYMSSKLRDALRE